MALNRSREQFTYEINYRFLAISSALVLALAIGAFVVHSLQKNRVEETLLTRANEFAQKEDYAKASDYLFRYLRLKSDRHPETIKTRFRLAGYYDITAQANNQRIPRAIELYQEALQSGEKSEEFTQEVGDELLLRYRVRLVELLIRANRFKEASDLASSLAGVDAIVAKLGSQPYDPPGEPRQIAPEIDSITADAVRLKAVAQVGRWNTLDAQQVTVENSRLKSRSTNDSGAHACLLAALRTNPRDADIALAFANMIIRRSEWALIVDAPTRDGREAWSSTEAERQLIAEAAMARLLESCDSLIDADEKRESLKSTELNQLTRANLAAFVFRGSTNRNGADFYLDQAIRYAEQLSAKVVAEHTNVGEDNADESGRKFSSLANEIEFIESTGNRKTFKETVVSAWVAAGQDRIAEYKEQIQQAFSETAAKDTSLASEAGSADVDLSPSGLLGQAEAYFEEGRLFAPEDPRPFYGLADVELLRRGFEATNETEKESHANRAIDYLKIGIGLEPRFNAEAVTRLVQVLTELEDFGEAERFLVDMTNSIDAILDSVSIPDNDLRILREVLFLLDAELLVAQSKFDEAIVPLQQIYASNLQSGNPNWRRRISILLAESYARAGYPDRASGSLEEALRYSNSIPLLSRAAEIELANGEVNSAVAKYLRVVEARGEAADWFNLATAQLQQLRRLAPSQRDFQRVLDSLDEARERVEDGSIESVWRIDLLNFDVQLAIHNSVAVQEGDHDQDPASALERLRAIETQWPDDAELLFRLASLYSRDFSGSPLSPQDADRVVGRLKEIASSDSSEWSDMQTRVARVEATILLSRDQEDKARQILQKEISRLTKIVAELGDSNTPNSRDELKQYDQKGVLDEEATAAAIQSARESRLNTARLQEQLLSLEFTILNSYMSQQDLKKVVDYCVGNWDSSSDPREELFTGSLVGRYPELSDLIANQLFKLCYTADYVISDNDAAFELFTRSEGAFGTYVPYFKAREALEASKNRPQLKNRKLDEARSYLNDIRRTRREWAPGYFIEGLIHLAADNPNRAVAPLQKAIQLGDTRPQTYLQLMLAHNMTGHGDEAMEIVDILAGEISDSDQLTAFAAGLANQIDKSSKAMHLVDSRLAQTPDNANAMVLKAQLLSSQGQLESAEAWLVKAKETSPGNLAIWADLFTFYQANDMRGKAIATLDEIEKARAAGTIDVKQPALWHVAIARFASLLGGADYRGRAESEFRAAIAASPKDDDSTHVIRVELADFLMFDKPQEAVQLLRIVFESPSAKPELRQAAGVGLASLYGRLGLRDKSAEVIGKLGQEFSSLPTNLRSRAILRMREADNELDEQKQNQILRTIHDEVAAKMASEAVPTDEDRLLLAAIALQLSNLTALSFDEQEEMLLKAIQLHDEVRSKDDPPISQSVDLAQLVIMFYQRQMREHDLDWRAIQSSLDRDQITPVLFPEQLLVEVQRTIEKSLDRTEIDIRPQLLWIRWHELTGEPDASREKIDSFLDNSLQRTGSSGDNKVKARVYLAAAELYRTIEDFESAEKFARNAHEIDPTKFVALADAIKNQGRLRDAIDFVVSTYESLPEERRQAALSLAALFTAEIEPTPEDFAKAETVFEDAKTRFPEDAQLWAGIGSVRVVQGNLAEAKSMYELAEKWAPNDPVVLNNYATLLSEQTSGEERRQAVKLIERAIVRYGEEPALLDTYGMALLALGQNQKAVSKLRLASRNQKADARVHFHLAVAYMRSSQDSQENARSSLEEAKSLKLENEVLTPKDRELLSELEDYLESGSS